MTHEIGDLFPVVFPDCTPRYMQTEEPVCVGECPRPCAIEVTNPQVTGKLSHYTINPTYETPQRDLGSGDRKASSYYYDADGRLIAHLDNLHWDAEKRIDAVDDFLPYSLEVKQRWHIAYDAAGRISSLSSRKRKVTLDYDASGRQVRERDGKNVTEFGYDDLGRLITIGADTRWTYDARGRLAQQVTQRPGGPRTIAYTYDDEDRVVRVERTGENPIMLAYRYSCP